MSIVASFAAFRENKKIAALECTMQDMVSCAISRMEEEAEAFFTKPSGAKGGGGISAMKVMNLESRVLAMENNPSGGLSYLTLTGSGTKAYTSSDFIFGTNIIGVNAPGPVTIQLPQTLTAGTIVKIKDESFSALSNNITVETYLEVL